MRLKLVLSLAAILVLSCQQNPSKVQDSTIDNMEVSNQLSLEEQKIERRYLRFIYDA